MTYMDYDESKYVKEKQRKKRSNQQLLILVHLRVYMMRMMTTDYHANNVNFDIILVFFIVL